MKPILFKLIFLLSVCNVLGNNLTTNTQKIEKKKVYKKEFNVSSNNTLTIDNEYGNVSITTWNENRINIEITVSAKSKDEKKADEKLDDIKILFSQNGQTVTAKTVIGSSFSWSFFKATPVEFEINYVVKMPITNNLNIDNDYGFIYLDKLNGSCILNSDYGGFTIGQLNSNSNNINLDYGKSSSIQYIKSGKISADYSILRIEKAEDLNLETDYTTTKINDIEKLTFNVDYGDLTINNANIIIGDNSYLGLSIGKIGKKLNLNADYGSVKINEITNGFENINIISEYADIKIGIEEKTNANYELKSNYGNISFEGISPTFIEKENNNSNKIYKGFLGAKTGNSLIKINSGYGNITIYKK